MDSESTKIYQEAQNVTQTLISNKNDFLDCFFHYYKIRNLLKNSEHIGTNTYNCLKDQNTTKETSNHEHKVEEDSKEIVTKENDQKI